MNVIYITHCTALMGANKSLITLMEDLKKRYGVNTILLVIRHRNKESDYQKLKEVCNAKGIPVCSTGFYCWQCDFKSAKIKCIVKKFLNVIYFKIICLKLNKYRIDIIHTNTSVTHLGQLLADRYCIPHIWHIREFGNEDYNLKYIYNELYVSNMYKKATLIIAISDCIKEKIRSISCNANVIRIYNGVDINKKIVKKDIMKECISFCCVGLISKGKNQFEIVEAVKILLEQGIKNFKVYFVGSGDDLYLYKIEKYVQNNKLSSNIEFLDFKDDVFAILENMDVGIVSSSMEAFGRVTIEYMLAQMPVIGADTGGTGELLENTEFGFLYEHGKPERLAEQMVKFIKNPCIIHFLGEKAQKTAEKKYSVKKNTDKIYECYLKVNI